MAFKFSGNADTSKFSMIDWSDVSGGRWDAQYYLSLSHRPNWIKLGKLVCIKGGKRLPARASFSATATPFRYLQVENLTQDGIDYRNMPYIDEDTYNTLKRYSLNDSDVVLSIAGTIGKASIFRKPEDEDVILTENCAKLIDTKLIIQPEFLKIILQCSFVQAQMSIAAPKTTIQKLSLERIAHLLIPAVPDRKKQQDVISLIHQAESLRNNKLVEAKRLLDSIDEYFINELGINLPKGSTNTIHDRMFTRDWSDVSGSRWDAAYLFSSIFHFCGTKYNLEKLGGILVRKPQYGANEIGLPRHSNDEVQYVRITDIDDSGSLKSGLGVTARTIEQKYVLFPNDLLIARSGSVGRSYLHRNCSHTCIFAGYLIRFRVNSMIALPGYVFEYTQSALFKKWVSIVQRTTSQPNISATEYASLPILLPSIEIQESIVRTISVIRKEINQLKAESMTIVNEAKKEVERLILGE